VKASPIVGDDAVYVGSGNGKLFAVNFDGSQKWVYSTGGYIYSTAAIGDDGTIYIASVDKKLYALNSNGTKKWEFETRGGIYSSPAIGSDGTVYVGSNDHRIYAVRGNTPLSTTAFWPKFHKNLSNSGR
jgi:outer membrane protein assembly factor BamB